MRKQGRVREGKGIILNPTIVPEGSGRTIPNVNKGDVTVGGKLVANNFPKVGGGSRWIITENRIIVQKPFPLGSLGTSEQLVNKLQKQTSILGLQIF
jgi:hypothetical protein